MKPPLLACCAALALAVAAPFPRASAEVTEKQVDASIRKGCEWLLGHAQGDGRFTSDGIWHWYLPPLEDVLPVPRGTEAIIMCALAHAGTDMSDDRVRKGFEYLIRGEPKHTYMAACRVIALARLLPRLRREQAELARKVMRRDVAWLLKTQQKTTDPDPGMWAYPTERLFRADFSNTQMAILALQEFELVGGELRGEPFARALKPYLELQNADGGWNYGNISHRGTPSYGSMTAAGVASLFIIRDKLSGAAGCPCRGGRSGKRPEKIDRSIQRGITWLGDSFVANRNPPKNRFGPYYWLYAVQRVALASGLKYLGTHDWYREGAEFVVRSQRPNGCWDDRANYVQDNCFAIMFLAKGRSLILMNKLQFDGAWDMHPRDAANLCRFVGKTKEQPIGWQAINLDVPVDEMHDAPILYVSAESVINLTDEHKKKLREFTDTGGTLLFEASCGNRTVARWWQKTCEELWPEWELKQIGKEHPLWSADQKIAGRLPPLEGISDGLRTFLFFARRDVSCAWSTMAVIRQRPLFDLGTNLYAYSTDRGRLRARLAGRSPEGEKYAGATIARGAKDTVTIARIKHGGDWYLGRNYHPWRRLSADLSSKAGLTLKESDPLAPGQAVPAGTDVLVLAGRAACTLDADGARRLKTYLDGGGFLVAEAILGDPRFDAALRTTMKQVGLTLKRLPADSPAITGSFATARGYDVSEVAFTSSLRAERLGKPEPELWGLYSGGGQVGLYSPLDVTFSQTGCAAWGNRGYAAADARAIASNIALLVSDR